MADLTPVRGPRIVYFKADGTRGLGTAVQEHGYWTFNFDGKSRDSDFSVAADRVKSVCPEDGGIGFSYGVLVEYTGNSGGYLNFAKDRRSFKIAEQHVRRVLQGKKAIWQNLASV